MGLFGGAGSSAGIPITPLSALQALTVPVRQALSEELAGLHYLVERLVPGHGWTADTDHPLNNLLIRSNDWMTQLSSGGIWSRRWNCAAMASR